MLKNKVILITGGTGSFGNIFLKYILEKEKPKAIRIFSRDEMKQYQMRQIYKQEHISWQIGDIRDLESVDKAMYGVDYVLHAAALKQVFICEENPFEAYKTNVEGSKNVFDSAIKHGVNKVLILSTDKAANPSNTLGLTKALMEKIALHYADIQNKTSFICMRFVNLLGSRGSVLPLFIENAKKNEPLSVTHKDVTRYIITPKEVIGLLNYIFSQGKNGYTYILKPKSLRIYDLAEVIIKKLQSKSKIELIGLRKGDKMHESLFGTQDFFLETPNLFYALPANMANNKLIKPKNPLTDYTSEQLDKLSKKAILKLLEDL